MSHPRDQVQTLAWGASRELGSAGRRLSPFFIQAGIGEIISSQALTCPGPTGPLSLNFIPQGERAVSYRVVRPTVERCLMGNDQLQPVPDPLVWI